MLIKGITMYIYGVSVHVDEDIAAEFEGWMKEEHLPDVLATDCFKEVRFMRLLEPEAQEGQSFAVQYLLDDHKQYEDYLDNHATALREATAMKFGEKVHAFRTYLEVLYMQSLH